MSRNVSEDIPKISKISSQFRNEILAEKSFELN